MSSRDIELFPHEERRTLKEEDSLLITDRDFQERRTRKKKFIN